MVNPAMEGMGNATLSGTKPSYRQLSVGEADAARRTEEDEVCNSVMLHQYKQQTNRDSPIRIWTHSALSSCLRTACWYSFRHATSLKMSFQTLG